jgi:hypothetical protein
MFPHCDLLRGEPDEEVQAEEDDKPSLDDELAAATFFLDHQALEDKEDPTATYAASASCKTKYDQIKLKVEQVMSRIALEGGRS